MDEFTEKRFGYLRELTTDEKLNKIAELEEDIKSSEEMLNDRRVSGEEKTELHNDIKYDKEVINYLNHILEEKHL